MKRYLTLPALALVLAVAGPAAGYETLEEDFSVCLGGPDQSSKEAVVGACTRLIDNAQTENSIVGTFYAMRAMSNDDGASNCRDAQKSLELADQPSTQEASQSLIDLYC